jgi:methionyl-tRNA synthetase
MPAPRFYITTPIYYVNDAPHIGHAYTSLACDVLARFKRLDGYDVMFLTGTDEHGQKIAKAAAAAGIDPQAFTDKVSQNFRDLSKALNLSNNDFIRTTEARHKKACQTLWNELLKRGEIYLDKYEGWYAVRDEAYYGEDELKDGPNGAKIAPSGAPCEWVEEPSYFFKLSAWGDRLLKFYNDNPDFILPHSRRNEVVSFVKSGMRDISVSRTTVNWGVPVPGEPKHVMYVWLDALTNYITGVGYPDTNAESFKRFWPADLHMVGKDILRFHAIYWPAFLMAAGLAPPKRVFAHGWWTNEGQKISKSLGNVIDPYELISTYGLDQTRYFLLRAVPFGNDGDFSRERMVNTTNSELANNIGNLAQRTLSMIAKNCDGKIPEKGHYEVDDNKLSHDVRQALELDMIRNLMNACEFDKVLEKIVQAASYANAYIDTQAPWALKKTNISRMHTVLYNLCEQIRKIAIFLRPFMPVSADKILDQLSIPKDQRSLAHISLEAVTLKPGTPLPTPEGIFPRYMENAPI